jgi:CheY-like chemotaxis protein
MKTKQNILIIEDDPAWATVIKDAIESVLDDMRFKCVFEIPETNRQRRDAVRAAADQPYDLVSLDIHLANDGSTTEPIDGLYLLDLIRRYNAAWMVSIFTGIENDETVGSTYGTEAASRLQNNLRARAYASFSPDRLLVTEKPALNSNMVDNRIRQICMILLHSSSARNLFRALKLENLTPYGETITGELLSQDSKEYKIAEKAHKFVQTYETKFSQERKKTVREEYLRQKGLDVLAKNGKRLKNTQWIEGVIELRQIRFNCGEVVTLPDGPYFRTVAKVLEKPGKEFSSHELFGESDEAPTTKGFDLQMGTTSEIDVDITDIETRKSYIENMRRLKNQLETAEGNTRKRILQDIADFKGALKRLRTGVKGGKGSTTVGQHKSRCISRLKEHGQVELALHLEKYLKIENFKIVYKVPPGEFLWTV